MENQIKAGAALNYVIIGINALVGLLYTPYMLRMLGQNEYGLFSLVASVISYLTIWFRVWQCYRKIHRKVSDGKQND